MNIILTAINARYVHTNLAVRYLNTRLKNAFEVSVVEYTINHDYQEILRELYLSEADVVAFSCYIWNIEIIIKIVNSLKKIKPEMQIILGGPEVTYDAQQIMKSCDAIDFIITGEGVEEIFELVDALANDKDYTNIPGINYRIRGQIYSNPDEQCLTSALLELSAYEYEPNMEHDKIYYYETSRGCPFSCQFCLSGNDSGVIFFPLEKVFKELEIFLDAQVKQVKLVDRTFNADHNRTMKLWQFLKEHDNGVTNFHFEISSRLLTEEMLVFLETVPPGLFQFEIGIQTTCKQSLKAIGRSQEQEREFSVIQRLIRSNNIHIHVDLIAGLPYEDIFQFRTSFDQVFHLQADMLQLGFLKLLKGSGLRNKMLDYGYVYQDHPPYEVLESHAINYSEIIQLKQVEEVLERYWNHGHYRETIRLTLDLSKKSPFAYFSELALLWKKAGGWQRQIGQAEQFDILRRYLHQTIVDDHMFVDHALLYDCALAGYRGKLPDEIHETMAPINKELIHELLHHVRFREKYFPDMKQMPSKKYLPFVKMFSLPAQLKIENGHLKVAAYDYSAMVETRKDWLIIYPRNRTSRNQHIPVVNVEEELELCGVWEEGMI
ncbi:B12-binding domain-containing radical SAM protein [Anoxynatronum sibiricum]|uniref:DUF4080 domain-containing protein n=1 Tax=Anoxynatronum sibiricum TaxID=210623 RepID=A0ABU9VVX0_9CLOT